jgi:nucleoside 2-deoxyribosyltransferase
MVETAIKPSVYVATGLENRTLAAQVISALREAGFRITYDWTTHGSVSGEPLERRREVALDEANGVRKAALLVVLLPGGRGTHVEMGIAIGLAIPVVLISEDDPGRTIFYESPGVYQCRISVSDIAGIVHNVTGIWHALTEWSFPKEQP